ncbi:ATP-dependent endonuclease [Pseudomonas aeruginosa]|uniref:ATP-dependent nuclease n=1 Tax=Pseudomonas aeruginosa TaxID=287 RepID=UPI000E2A39CA|nr:ATP-dependent endonuclease [Pseudomonas aeruginosa]MBG5164162.1 ATP-dependent endonuclease [Pseudomonas aeruginosa]MBV6363774.1 ATP-dependent endonuclease [Pseudomonas aeruginosa]TQI29426.1 ATP-dependent endonuclease [Pseudomonas aeruginosa]HEJ6356569.1 ATP-dependent endonuclease [Pseudomonas aeruginosa]
MHLAELNISNFRKLREAKLCFQAGLNVLVGANNVGKSAVVDALRALLAGHEEPYPRFDVEDRHRPQEGEPEGDIDFHYVFRDLSHDDEADFLAALKPGLGGQMEAHIHVRYSDADMTGRFRVKRWCGDHEDVPLSSDMMENLRGVYLQPLRDASQSLRPSRNSQLSRLLHLFTDGAGREGINEALRDLDEQLKQHAPILNTQAAIVTRHSDMLGDQLAQALAVGLSASDFQRLSSRLSLSVDAFEIEQNGLGFNNLIFMAVVLSELAKNTDATYRGLIVEEPEAHLHPQLQAVLLRYLASLSVVAGEKPVQLFVTSHSTNFASNAKLDCLACLVESEDRVETFFPRKVQFKKGKREKLERYLDVTRAELFFARRVIFVEGAAELMLVDALATKAGFDLRANGVSLISVEGLNFDSFLPLFGENALRIPVALITDADPQAQAEKAEDEGDEGDEGDEEDEGDEGDEEAKRQKTKALYPALGDEVVVSRNTAKMKAQEDRYVKVFHGVKTLEYDLALHEINREAMLTALADPHPKIAKALRKAVEAEEDNTSKARVLFRSMFERRQNNVQKGRFGQALAQVISDGANCEVPDYIRKAIEHVCQVEER